MLNFDIFVSRHGEFGAQALIERIERYEGIHANDNAFVPLETRWNALMQKTADYAPVV